MGADCRQEKCQKSAQGIKTVKTGVASVLAYAVMSKVQPRGFQGKLLQALRSRHRAGLLDQGLQKARSGGFWSVRARLSKRASVYKQLVTSASSSFPHYNARSKA